MGNFFSNLWNDITGKTQANQMKKAADAQTAASSNATAAQLAWEKEQAARLNKMQDFMWASGSADRDHYSPIAQDWQAQYLNYLQNAPDTTYNAQRGTMERAFADETSAAARAMRGRGMQNSGLFSSTMGNLQLKRAGMLSGLEGERNDRRGQMISQGTQYTQGLLDQAMNRMMSVAQMPQLNSTQVPQMMMNAGNNAYASAMAQANQANPIANAASSLAQGWIMNQFGNKNSSSSGSGSVQGVNPFYGYTGNGLAKTGLNAIMGANGIPFSF